MLSTVVTGLLMNKALKEHASASADYKLYQFIPSTVVNGLLMNEAVKEYFTLTPLLATNCTNLCFAQLWLGSSWTRLWRSKLAPLLATNCTNLCFAQLWPGSSWTRLWRSKLAPLLATNCTNLCFAQLWLGSSWTRLWRSTPAPLPATSSRLSELAMTQDSSQAILSTHVSTNNA